MKSGTMMMALASLALATTSAQAGYEMTFTGPDFGTPDTVVFNGDGPYPTYYSWAGSTTDQTWPLGGLSRGGWIDFSPGGTDIGIEGDPTLTRSVTFTASSSFFTLTTPYLSGIAPGTYSITNTTYWNGPGGTDWEPYLAEGYGNVDTLTIDAVPEATTWGMLVAGFFGLAAAGLSRRRAPINAIV